MARPSSMAVRSYKVQVIVTSGRQRAVRVLRRRQTGSADRFRGQARDAARDRADGAHPAGLQAVRFDASSDHADRASPRHRDRHDRRRLRVRSHRGEPFDPPPEVKALIKRDGAGAMPRVARVRRRRRVSDGGLDRRRRTRCVGVRPRGQTRGLTPRSDPSDRQSTATGRRHRTGGRSRCSPSTSSGRRSTTRSTTRRSAASTGTAVARTAAARRARRVAGRASRKSSARCWRASAARISR